LRHLLADQISVFNKHLMDANTSVSNGNCLSSRYVLIKLAHKVVKVVKVHLYWSCLRLFGTCQGLSEPVRACLVLSGRLLACLGLSWFSELVWTSVGISELVLASLSLTGKKEKNAVNSGCLVPWQSMQAALANCLHYSHHYI
jgi:hypothetical protein